MLAECVDIRSGRRFRPGETFDPAPTEEQARRLVVAGVLPEGAIEASKKAEADAEKKASEAKVSLDKASKQGERIGTRRCRFRPPAKGRRDGYPVLPIAATAANSADQVVAAGATLTVGLNATGGARVAEAAVVLFGDGNDLRSKRLTPTPFDHLWEY